MRTKNTLYLKTKWILQAILLSLCFFAFANGNVARAESPPVAAKGKLRIHLDTEFFRGHIFGRSMRKEQ